MSGFGLRSLAEMLAKAILNGLLFVLFFTAGIAAIALSALAPEIHNVYAGRVLLQRIEKSNKQLRAINDQYEYQLNQIKQNPAILARLRVLNLGIEPDEPDTAFPPAKSEQLIKAARDILKQEQETKEQVVADIPVWLRRVQEPRQRVALFIAGAALVIVSMIFFSTPRDASQDSRPADTA